MDRLDECEQHVLHEGPYRDCLEVSCTVLCKVPFWQKQVAQCFVRLPTGRSELHSALHGSQPTEVSCTVLCVAPYYQKRALRGGLHFV